MGASNILTALGPSVESHRFSRKDTSFPLLSRRRKVWGHGLEECHICYAQEPKIFLSSDWYGCTLLCPEFSTSVYLHGELCWGSRGDEEGNLQV